MANGELCRHCRQQETPHVYWEYSNADTCSAFESETIHLDDCPLLGCTGDCDSAIAERDWQAMCQENRTRQTWLLSGPSLVVLDIGT